MNDDYVLPSWIGITLAAIVFAVSLGLIYYGVHDGMVDQDIAYRTKAGKVSVANGFSAVIIGIVFTGLGIALARVASLILNSSKTKR